LVEYFYWEQTEIFLKASENHEEKESFIRQSVSNNKNEGKCIWFSEFPFFLFLFGIRKEKKKCHIFCLFFCKFSFGLVFFQNFLCQRMQNILYPRIVFLWNLAPNHKEWIARPHRGFSFQHPTNNLKKDFFQKPIAKTFKIKTTGPSVLRVVICIFIFWSELSNFFRN
jgi:hypothetical protein